MPDFFQWSDDQFALHISEMDAEHKVLVDKMNVLHKAWVEKASYEELLNNLQDLARYTVIHFKDEEIYMEKIKYEGLATHKIIHEQLLKQFQSYVDDFVGKKTMNEDLFKFLKVWLTSHIRGIDMKYAQMNLIKK